MNEKKKADIRLNRGIAFLLSLVMVISLIPVSAYGDWDWGWILGEKKDGVETEVVAPADSGKAETPKTSSRKNENQKLPEELIVGHTTETKGDFFTEKVTKTQRSQRKKQEGDYQTMKKFYKLDASEK